MADAAVKAWRCSACGYVHRGSQPPECCPVCGAVSSAFELYVDAQPAAAAPKPQHWRCLNCSYIHEGPEPPAECPVCGAPRERFEPLPIEDPAPAAGKAVRVVIIGAGIAGVSAAEAVRSASGDAEITLVSREPDLPYYRLNLTRYLAGEIGLSDLPMHPQGWYAQQGIEVKLNAEATELDLEGHSLTLGDDTRLPYEKLILASGAHSFVPPIPGADIEGVTVLRTVADCERILHATKSGARCICIGGGLLGLETAGALAKRGAHVTLLEGHGWLMPRQLTPLAGSILREHIVNLGIVLRMEAKTKAILGEGHVSDVLLEDGTRLEADLVVIAAGVRPNSYLARRAGLEVNSGVVVNNHLVTSHPDVLAAGDLTEHRGVVYGTWGPSQFQGSIAGMNAVGLSVEFGGMPRANTLKVLGLDLLSIGQFQPEDGSFQVIEDEGDGRYRRFVFHDGRLVGSILLGDTSIASALKNAMEGRRDFSGLLQRQPTAKDIFGYLTQG
ncbi:MAG: FAD-dependent oxidoreductase [Planctomycetaceae bacterium]|nr:FAD-dependent oxidoreductase [Planctomycetaceae bacterium]